MRTIKFRGKVEGANEWVYGNLCNECTIQSIQELESTRLRFNRFIVIPETVGQFTGLHDKNGKEIYEGDIVNLAGGYIGNVKWDNFFCGWVQVCINAEQISIMDGKTIGMFNGREYEVIGNIYDNPELLKEQGK